MSRQLPSTASPLRSPLTLGRSTCLHLPMSAPNRPLPGRHCSRAPKCGPQCGRRAREPLLQRRQPSGPLSGRIVAARLADLLTGEQPPPGGPNGGRSRLSFGPAQSNRAFSGPSRYSHSSAGRSRRLARVGNARSISSILARRTSSPRSIWVWTSTVTRALLGELRGSPQRSLRILHIGEQLPLAWEPLERVDSTILKDPARGQRDDPCDLRYQDLALVGRGHDARRFMYGDATNIGADQLHLTDVDANANPQALPARGSADRGSAAPARDR
jgi:hypothetical protein